MMRARNVSTPFLAVAALAWGSALGAPIRAQDRTGERPPGEAAEVPADPPAPAPEQPVTPAIGLAEPRYRTMGDVRRVLAGWAEARPDACRLLVLGTTRGGLELVGLELGRPGRVALAERPTIFLVGAPDGRSLAGMEAVLAAAGELLRGVDALPPDVAYVAVPGAAPDGLARWLAGWRVDGRNGLPVDDDHDGLVDEDGPDDLDGDGKILELLIEDPAGPWARDADPRLLQPARPGDWPRYTRGPEGRDDDGDGRFNEDLEGGVVLDLNFPGAWRGPWTGDPCGPYPLSEPDAKALADLFLARKAVLALVFQGNHGSARFPLDPFTAAEAPGIGPLAEAGERWLARAFERTTGRLAVGPGAKERAAAPGALGWVREAVGALGVEIAPWGPQIDGGPDPDGGIAEVLTAAWTRWLDNTRGGIGFVDWHPVDLGDGRQGLVGGWEPRTCWNPPAESLPGAIAPMPAFARAVADGLPRLEIEVRGTERRGDLCRLRVRIRNLGDLPTGLDRSEGIVLALQMPEGAKLLAGRERTRLDNLPGRGATPLQEWLVTAPAGASFRLTAEARWTSLSMREVRP